MTASPFVSRAEAMKRPTHHQFIVGVGFLAHSAPPDLPDDARGDKNCAPPERTQHEGSLHVLQPPGDHPPMTLIWSVEHGAWIHPVLGRGNRVAWTPDHLSKAGWEYVGPAKKAKRA